MHHQSDSRVDYSADCDDSSTIVVTDRASCCIEQERQDLFTSGYSIYYTANIFFFSFHISWEHLTRLLQINRAFRIFLSYLYHFPVYVGAVTGQTPAALHRDIDHRYAYIDPSFHCKTISVCKTPCYLQTCNTVFLTVFDCHVGG